MAIKVIPSGYHIVVRGFTGEDDEVPETTHRFLRALFTGPEAVDTFCPVKYCGHQVITSEEGKLIRFKSTSPDEISPRDENLTEFCSRFFTYNGTPQAYYSLSEFGKLGYSPDTSEESMNLAWYRALFTWLQEFRSNEIAQLEGCLADMAKRPKKSSWLPSWMGVGMMAVSLAVGTWFPTTERLHRGADILSIEHPNRDLVAWAGTFIQQIANNNEEDSSQAEIELKARNSCAEFITQSNLALTTMRTDAPATLREHVYLQVEVLKCLVSLYDAGFKTVTVCKRAVDAFLSNRRSIITKTLATGVTTVTSIFNYSLYCDAISEVQNAPLQPNRAALLNDLQRKQLPHALQAALGIGYIAWNGWSAYKQWTKECQWEEIATYVNAVIRHTQMCELWIHLVYNTGDGLPAMSEEYYRALDALMESHKLKNPTAVERSPEAVRERILFHAKVLSAQKEKVQKLLLLT
ncbi:hypothetical protein V8F20_004355 [Naviculisporaceae sp. PSN 640]